MKNKKGFTLIELLAVIILIGLIAVLIVPKVIRTISDSKKGIGKASTSALLRVADNYFVEQKLKGNFQGCVYDFTNNINTCDGIDFSGEKPQIGKLSIGKDGKVRLAVKYEDTCYVKRINTDDITSLNYDESTCTYESNISVGQEVTIAGEPFYVIDTNEDETKLIAKYNLLVGKTCTGLDEELDGICTTINPSTQGYGLQSETALGWTEDEFPTIGVTEFSDTNYWSSGVGSTYPGSYYISNEFIDITIYDGYPYVYDSNSTLYNYVENYKTYLNNNGGNIKSARLLTTSEAIDLDCIYNSQNTCVTWISNTSFWLADADNSADIMYINAENKGLYNYEYDWYESLGVRPVIIIDTIDL